jgi:predicted Fe-Mo cluster-binding NifX family protein
MKIAFTTKGTEWDSMMDPRFGRTEFILIYIEKKDEFTMRLMEPDHEQHKDYLNLILMY